MVRPHGETRFSLHGVSWNFVIMDFFGKSVEEIQVWLKSDKNNGYLTWRPMYVYNNISLNSSQWEMFQKKSGREYQNKQ